MKNTAFLPSRRDFLKMSFVGVGALALPPALFVFAQDTASFDMTIMPGSPPDTPGGWTTLLPPVPDGLPMNPPITITSNRTVGVPLVILGNNTSQDNPFTRLVSNQLGIIWQPKWEGGSAEEVQWQLSIASNDLPDVLDWVPPTTFEQLLAADLLEDITDAWDKFADPVLLKPIMEANPNGWSYVKKDGRIYGVPVIQLAAQNDKVMWIRQDWLDKVGMDVPQTLDELEAVMRAFVDAKLGGEDTYGLVAGSHMNTWVDSLDPIFGAFDVMISPNEGSITSVWRENEAGELMFDSIRPEMREALATLRRWYADKLLRADFLTVDSGTSVEDIVANRVGIAFSPYWFAGWGVAGSVENDPDARWIVADVPAGPNGKRGKNWSNPFTEYSYAFRKGFPYVEQVIKYWNWLAALYQEPERRMHGWQGINYELSDGTYVPYGDDVANPWWQYFYAFTGFDPELEYKRSLLVEEWRKLPADQLDAYQKYALENSTGINGLVNEASNLAITTSNEQGIKNLFTRLPTEAMKLYGADLAALEQQTALGIITGEKPLEEFDTFVETWKSLGGDQVTAEVNEWWQSR